ncbi:hypothetical protein RM863_35215 [Streptomyces sp. DSM 41014]|uniref:Secreted protein n=1 Tax=Streptomyces hintoniae TaxID=3075521 RepID=A0ABU2UWI8_9ACTN|nr:hypothetical protein [Streptomyces sp. DSM 41014]MDT0477385.1 hypothetical protein [Streptomyces sp. DSM 41014]
MAHHAPSTALAAARLLAAQGHHSHLHSEAETTCVSGHCAPTPAVLGTTLLTTPEYGRRRT